MSGGASGGGGGSSGRSLRVATPEGVPLRFTIASLIDRGAAFLIDLGILLVILCLLSFVVLFITLGSESSGGSSDGWLFAFLMLVGFFVRNFYFVWFEMRWQGVTPGKRVMGLRTIDASGGALTGEAIFVRNLTRDMEFFFPLTALVMPERLWPGAPGWAQLLSSLWLVAVALMPWLNRRRLRLGDLLAGTLVVHLPRTLLLEDLSLPIDLRSFQPQPTLYTFTQEQLEIYGIYELQVLENLLRRPSPRQREVLRSVCDAIQGKIDWDGTGPVDPSLFLRDFYVAQRARLEQKILFGERKESKVSSRKVRQAP